MEGLIYKYAIYSTYVIMLVKEVMTHPVITIDSEQSILDACNMYRDYKIGCLIVTCKGSSIGLVTERDIIERTICARKNAEKTKIKDIMTTDILTIHPLEQVEKAIDVMMKNNIKKLPVVSNGEVVGIITATDISRARPDLSKRFIDTWVKPEWHD